MAMATKTFTFTPIIENVIVPVVKVSNLESPVYIYATGVCGGEDPTHLQTQTNIAQFEEAGANYIVVSVASEKPYDADGPKGRAAREKAVGDTVFAINKQLGEEGFTNI